MEGQNNLDSNSPSFSTRFCRVQIIVGRFQIITVGRTTATTTSPTTTTTATTKRRYEQRISFSNSYILSTNNRCWTRQLYITLGLVPTYRFLFRRVHKRVVGALNSRPNMKGMKPSHFNICMTTAQTLWKTVRSTTTIIASFICTAKARTHPPHPMTNCVVRP